MKKKIVFLYALALVSLLLGGCRPQEPKPPAGEITIPEKREKPLDELRYVPGEVLVRFKEEVTNEEKTAIISKLGFEVIEKVILTDIYRLKLPPGVTVGEAVERLKELEEIEVAQPNYIYRIGIQEEKR
jgi:hypothetical protein